MRKLLLVGSIIAATVFTATPGSAQFYGGAGPGGVGVQVGPFGAGVGPAYGWRDRHYNNGYNNYGSGECRVVRQRVHTPSGRLITKTRRVCD